MTRVASQLQKYSAIAAFAMLLAVQWSHSPFHHLAAFSGHTASEDLALCHFHSSTHVHVGHKHSHSHGEEPESQAIDDCLGHSPAGEGKSSEDGSDHSEECELCDDLSKSLVHVALVGELVSSPVVAERLVAFDSDYDCPIHHSRFARGPPCLA